MSQVNAAPRIEREADVLARTGLSRTPLRNAVARGLFPKPFKLKPSRSIGWLSSEVDDWIAARAAEREEATK